MDVRMACACGHELIIEETDGAVVEHFFRLFHTEHAHDNDRALTAAASPTSATFISSTDEDDDETA